MTTDPGRTVLEPDAGLRGFLQLSHAALHWIYVTCVSYAILLRVLSTNGLHGSSVSRKSFPSSVLDALETKLDAVLPALNDNEGLARRHHDGQSNTWSRCSDFLCILKERAKLHAGLYYVIAKAHMVQLWSLACHENGSVSEDPATKKNSFYCAARVMRLAFAEIMDVLTRVLENVYIWGVGKLEHVTQGIPSYYTAKREKLLKLANSVSGYWTSDTNAVSSPPLSSDVPESQ